MDNNQLRNISKNSSIYFRDFLIKGGQNFKLFDQYVSQYASKAFHLISIQAFDENTFKYSILYTKENAYEPFSQAVYGDEKLNVTSSRLFVVKPLSSRNQKGTDVLWKGGRVRCLAADSIQIQQKSSSSFKYPVIFFPESKFNFAQDQEWEALLNEKLYRHLCSVVPEMFLFVPKTSYTLCFPSEVTKSAEIPQFFIEYMKKIPFCFLLSLQAKSRSWKLKFPVYLRIKILIEANFLSKEKWNYL